MASVPDVGDTGPDFTLPSTRGEITLSKALKKGAVLLVFYPGDDTPVCTKQLCDYRDNLGVFSGLGVDVVALNPQPLASHEKFATKYQLPFPLAADADKRVCEQYGAVGFLGMTKRALVLVGRDGLVKYRRTDFPIFRRTAEELRDVIKQLNLG